MTITPSSSDSPKPHRRRGGQPGNHNALTHGFYSRYFTQVDVKDLGQYAFSGLDDEVALIRIYIRHLIELGSRPDSPYDPLTILRAICLASSSLTRLLKTQKLVFGQKDELREMLDRVIAQAQEEQGWPIL